MMTFATVLAAAPSQAGSLTFNFAGTPSAGSLPGSSQTWSDGSFSIQTSADDGRFSTDQVDQVRGLGLGICQQETDRRDRPDGRCSGDNPAINGDEMLQINLGSHPGWTLDDLVLEVSPDQHYEVYGSTTACTGDDPDRCLGKPLTSGEGKSCGDHRDGDCLDVVTLNLSANNKDQFIYVMDDNDGRTLLVNSVTGVTVPEPMSLTLLAGGLLGFAYLRRRRAA